MIQQLSYLLHDARRIVNGRWHRLLVLPFSHGFAAVAMYRFERGCWLTFGPRWPSIRILLAPLLALIRPWAGSAIHYKAEIGPGLLILHPSLGVVVSGHAIIGRDAVLTGGNVIGTRPRGNHPGSVVLGDSVNLGSHAVVLGPVSVGDRVSVGANAVVLHDVEPDSTVVGAPARPV